MRWLTGQTAAMWNAITGGDSEKQTEAIAYWARRRTDMPGPISFTLPRDLSQKEQQRVLATSEPRCMCGRERRYIPTQPRDFYDFPKPKPRLITLGAQEQPLAITIWGGGILESVVELSVVDDSLIRRSHPYSDKPGYASMTLERLKENLQGRIRPAAASLNVTTPGLANPYRFEIYAVYNIDTRLRKVQVLVSRNCMRADPTKRSKAHTCS